jgi:hypothetical protein
MAVLTSNSVRFGPFELDRQSGELYKHCLRLKLQGYPIQILGMLVERPRASSSQGKKFGRSCGRASRRHSSISSTG